MPDNAERIHIDTRWFVSADLPEALAIEKESFPIPWVEEDFRALMAKRNVIGIVARCNPLQCEEEEGPILGYAIYELHDNYIEILTLAVHPSYHRRSIGKQLTQKLQSKLSAVKSRRRIEIRVPEECLALQLMLRGCGFLATSIRHFAGSTHFGSKDKYVMEWFKHDPEPSFHSIELDNDTQEDFN